MSNDRGYTKGNKPVQGASPPKLHTTYKFYTQHTTKPKNKQLQKQSIYTNIKLHLIRI